MNKKKMTMKLGVADYGMNVWDGALYDTAQRLADLKRIGYEGVERMQAASAADAMAKAVEFRRLGMDFATCRGPAAEESIKWTAALGKRYVWAESRSGDFDVFCRQVRAQAQAASAFGLRVGLHNHLGTPVETQKQLEAFLSECPACDLVLDTGHLAAAGGDAVAVIEKHADRLVAVHVKDWMSTGATQPVGNPEWNVCGYFTTLGNGNIGQDNAAVVAALASLGYAGWVFVEHDTHLQDPLVDLAESLAFLRAAF
jgi:sugar phosphate isomerase/epimerase